VDLLILGCTHFPLVRDIFDAEAEGEIVVLDSAVTTANAVARVLDLWDMRADSLPWHRILVTGPADAFVERTQAMFQASPEIETVDLALP
jgi:glutamate racemase